MQHGKNSTKSRAWYTCTAPSILFHIYLYVVNMIAVNMIILLLVCAYFTKFINFRQGEFVDRYHDVCIRAACQQGQPTRAPIWSFLTSVDCTFIIKEKGIILLIFSTFIFIIIFVMYQLHMILIYMYSLDVGSQLRSSGDRSSLVVLKCPRWSFLIRRFRGQLKYPRNGVRKWWC